MGRGDISIFASGGYAGQPTYNWEVDDLDTSSDAAILAGEPVKQDAQASEFLEPCADADLTIGTDQPFVGFTAQDSTAVAASNGNCDVYIPLPGMIYEIRSLSSTATDTQAEIAAMQGQHQVLDLTSSVYTMDTVAGAGANNAFLIVDGDPLRSKVRFMVRFDATPLGRGQV